MAQALPASTGQKADNLNNEVTIKDAFKSSTKKQINPWQGEEFMKEFIFNDLKIVLGTSLSKYEKQEDGLKTKIYN